ncbi:MAG: glycosyltransferase [Planctomycetota bacterium]|nr:glycosyltransferase [Planctomycetota bacterium]
MKRMLFFHQGKFSNTNAAVLGQLRSQLPNTDIRAVDINQMLKAKPSILLANLLAACRQYGWDMLRMRRGFDDSFFGTRHLFNRVRQWARQVQREWPSDCTFQTQSIFDCSIPGTPHFVYTDHTYESCKEYPVYGKAIWSPLRPEWLIEMERGIYEHAACTFTMSQNVTTTLIEKYGIPPDRVLCVRAGCNALQQRLCGIPLDLARYRKKRILFVGANWALTVVGFLSLNEVVEYYARASVFCMPSKIEAFGIVFLEALAAGLPVTALRLGATPDFVLPGRTGCLVEPGDVQGLADAMAGLLSRPKECREFGLAGRRLVQEQYTWDTVCNKIGCKVLGTLGAA